MQSLCKESNPKQVLPMLQIPLFFFFQTDFFKIYDNCCNFIVKCVFGGLGAMISGLLILKESVALRKFVAQSVKESALDFLVALDIEEKTVST
jgi:hypothetical protein